ncbi:MAG: rod shape-determining protein MreC [Verrucomicrobiae bacterium]|nr:rod shape-determining protein MreC [Verrucomicrobiae bacterium]
MAVEKGRGVLKNRDVVLVAIVVVGWVIVLGQPTVIGDRLRAVLSYLAGPLVRVADGLGWPASQRTLARENATLRTEVEQLRLREQLAREVARENRRLERLLKMRSRLPPTVIGARVIGRDASNWWQSVLIDRGRDDGVRENCVVVSADGLVGKTTAVTRNSARVLLLLDEGCRVSAVLEQSREPGVVQGLPGRARCEMRYVGREARVRPGEAIVTSGMGGVFPKGILIGHVLEARIDEQSGLYQRLEIEPATDFRRLEEVLVLCPTGP